MNNTKSLLLTGVRAAFFGAVALGAASTMAWTTAPANPPANNVAAPLNTSATAQSKAGKLSTTNAGYYVDLSRGDSWSFVSNGNVYASDVYSSASGKWLSDASIKVQTGIITLPTGSGVHAGSATFSSAYTTPPQVIISPVSFEYTGGCSTNAVRHNISVQSVSATSVTVQDTTNYWDGCNRNAVTAIQWMAIGN